MFDLGVIGQSPKTNGASAMKILIVTTAPTLVGYALERMREAGLDVSGILAKKSMMTPKEKYLSNVDALQMVKDADVIFLDHNMFLDYYPPNTRNGDELFADWQRAGIDFTGKRMIGISVSNNQTYLKEHFNADDLLYPTCVKNFLDL